MEESTPAWVEIKPGGGPPDLMGRVTSRVFVPDGNDKKHGWFPMNQAWLQIIIDAIENKKTITFNKTAGGTDEKFDSVDVKNPKQAKEHKNIPQIETIKIKN